MKQDEGANVRGPRRRPLLAALGRPRVGDTRNARAFELARAPTHLNLLILSEGVVISIRVVVESLGRRQQCFDDGELS